MPLKCIIVRYHGVVGFFVCLLGCFLLGFFWGVFWFFWSFGCFSILVCFGLVF